jgi:peptidoglycan hydrolase-like protein with peptidoglycan-binding domain
MRLKALGHYRGAIDNVYGPGTQAGVIAFHKGIIAMQKAYGQEVWPAPDALVGLKKIAMLRFFTP